MRFLPGRSGVQVPQRVPLLGIGMEIQKELCTFCGKAELKFVAAVPPYSAECFICPVCDSTYNVETEIVFESED